MIEGYDRTKAREYLNEGSWLARGLFFKIIVLVIVFGAVGFGLHLLFLPAALVSEATDPKTMISNYEEYQEIYNTCQKINSDLGTIRAVPDSDPMFAQFSKQAMIAQKRQLMSRWVEEYNAKSKMLNRKYWKSTALPYQLDVNEFNNYGG